MDGMEARAKALEIAVSILGKPENSVIENANGDGKEIIKHYLWLAKSIDGFILFGDILSPEPKLGP
jgi:hypothetical protein